MLISRSLVRKSRIFISFNSACRDALENSNQCASDAVNEHRYVYGLRDILEVPRTQPLVQKWRCKLTVIAPNREKTSTHSWRPAGETCVAKHQLEY